MKPAKPLTLVVLALMSARAADITPAKARASAKEAHIYLR